MDSLYLTQKCTADEFASTLIGSAQFPKDPHESLFFCQKARRLKFKAPDLIIRWYVQHCSKLCDQNTKYFTFLTLYSNLLEARAFVALAEKDKVPIDTAHVMGILDHAEMHLSSFKETIFNVFSAMYYAIRSSVYQLNRSRLRDKMKHLIQFVGTLHCILPTKAGRLSIL
jgi:hypothetical protein